MNSESTPDHIIASPPLEVVTFEAERDKLAIEHAGKVALIRGDQVQIFATREEARRYATDNPHFTESGYSGYPFIEQIFPRDKEPRKYYGQMAA